MCAVCCVLCAVCCVLCAATLVRQAQWPYHELPGDMGYDSLPPCFAETVARRGPCDRRCSDHVARASATSHFQAAGVEGGTAMSPIVPPRVEQLRGQRRVGTIPVHSRLLPYVESHARQGLAEAARTFTSTSTRTTRPLYARTPRYSHHASAVCIDLVPLATALSSPCPGSACHVPPAPHLCNLARFDRNRPALFVCRPARSLFAGGVFGAADTDALRPGYCNGRGWQQRTTLQKRQCCRRRGRELTVPDTASLCPLL